MKNRATRQYGSGTLEKGLAVLEALERSPDPLRIHDVATSIALDRAAVFRLLCTLEDKGYVERLPDKRYRAKSRGPHPRLAYIAPLTGNSFRVEVAAGMKLAAIEANIDLVSLDTANGDTRSYVSAVQELIERKVNLAILFQPMDSLAHLLADCFTAVETPVISVDMPLPGALFFGGNSYRAGLLAGNALGRHVKELRHGAFDKLILLESSVSGQENKARLSGTVDGIREVLGDSKVPETKIVHLDGYANRDASRDACHMLFQNCSARSELLISTFNDLSALGALDAIRTMKRGSRTSVVGQNGTPEVLAELLLPNSALLGSVAYFPEKYGEKLVRLASLILTHVKTPLATYTDHVFISRDNLAEYYPDLVKFSRKKE